MTPGRVTIITAVYNAAPTLEKCLLSVRHQSYGDIEHIVIDGGSTDGSVQILQRHSSLLAYWVSEPDSGFSMPGTKACPWPPVNGLHFLVPTMFYSRMQCRNTFLFWGNRRAVRLFSRSLDPSWPTRQNHRTTLELAGLPTQDDHGTCRQPAQIRSFR